MRPCNFCVLEKLRARAAMNREQITIKLSNKEQRGVNVYMHPRQMSSRVVSADESSVVHKRWIVARFIELPNVCCC